MTVRRVRLERFLCKVFYKMSYKLANRSLYGRYIDVEDKGYLTRSIIRRINAVFIHFFDLYLFVLICTFFFQLEQAYTYENLEEYAANATKVCLHCIVCCC